MRDLVRNTTPIWYVNVTGTTEVTDSHGNYTGEITFTYGSPVEARIAITPYSGDIIDRTFGKDVSLDMIGSSSILSFDENTLIFLSEPISSYDKTYDYSVSKIIKSLNSTLYGLKRRT